MASYNADLILQQINGYNSLIIAINQEISKIENKKDKSSKTELNNLQKEKSGYQARVNQLYAQFRNIHNTDTYDSFSEQHGGYNKFKKSKSKKSKSKKSRKH